jgi:hypothetical protein
MIHETTIQVRYFRVAAGANVNPVDFIITQCPVQGHDRHVEKVGGSFDRDEVRHGIPLLIECYAVYLVMVSHTQRISKAIVIWIRVSVIRALNKLPLVYPLQIGSGIRFLTDEFAYAAVSRIPLQ